MTPLLPAPIADWFAAKGWAPRRHQLEMLAAARAGRSALLVAPTGAGKTLAGFLPTLAELVEQPTDGLHTLYISPLKALAVDVQRNLLDPGRGDGACPSGSRRGPATRLPTARRASASGRRRSC